MADKLLVEIDLINGEANNAIPALVFLANQIYEAGVFEVGPRAIWKEKDEFDYQMKWRLSEDGEFVETIPVEFETLIDLKNLLSRVSTAEETDTERLAYLRGRVEDLVRSANMTLLCDRDG